MNTDLLLIAAYLLGLLALILGGTMLICWLFRLVDRAHRLAWIPLVGLLLTGPVTLGL